ncbi:MAG: hypothetical protein VX239_00285, partial [Candidatus Thermoplasmatota archaeon]|nr:hypothetical protein [Candidatus Thermoplasmatota archaeon]
MNFTSQPPNVKHFFYGSPDQQGTVDATSRVASDESADSVFDASWDVFADNLLQHAGVDESKDSPNADNAPQVAALERDDLAPSVDRQMQVQRDEEFARAIASAYDAELDARQWASNADNPDGDWQTPRRTFKPTVERKPSSPSVERTTFADRVAQAERLHQDESFVRSEVRKIEARAQPRARKKKKKVVEATPAKQKEVEEMLSEVDVPPLTEAAPDVVFRHSSLQLARDARSACAQLARAASSCSTSCPRSRKHLARAPRRRNGMLSIYQARARDGEFPSLQLT